MIGKIKDFFNNRLSAEKDETAESSEKRIQVAAGALLLEMASIDDEFSEEEGARILSLLKKEFGLTDETAAELIDLAKRELKGSVDLWQFTSLINAEYKPEEKIRLMELVWKVVYADGRLDKHEDYLVQKLTKLLNLRQSETIQAKLAALGRKK